MGFEPAVEILIDCIDWLIVLIDWLMHIYWKNNHAKFHPDLTWNDGALGFLKRVSQREEEQEQAQEQEQQDDWVEIFDQFLSQNISESPLLFYCCCRIVRLLLLYAERNLRRQGLYASVY